MIEAELKAALLPAQAKALPDALRALGFTEAGTVQETDLYLNGNDRDFRRTDEALRLRTVQTLPEGGAQTLITYKGPKIDAQSSSRLELETSVEDFETMKKLLLSLGYRAALTVKKRAAASRAARRPSVLTTWTGSGTIWSWRSWCRTKRRAAPQRRRCFRFWTRWAWSAARLPAGAIWSC